MYLYVNLQNEGFFVCVVSYHDKQNHRMFGVGRDLCGSCGIMVFERFCKMKERFPLFMPCILRRDTAGGLQGPCDPTGLRRAPAASRAHPRR